jgi:hypothetical protein
MRVGLQGERIVAKGRSARQTFLFNDARLLQLPGLPYLSQPGGLRSDQHEMRVNQESEPRAVATGPRKTSMLVPLYLLVK